MKILYIALCDLWANGEVGIKNKVFSQLKSLEKKNETYLVTWKNMMFCTFKYNKLIEKKVLLSALAMYEYIEEFVKEQGIDMVFLRYLQTNYWLNNFLKNIKKQHKIVIIDFPTIPYDEEIKGRVELEEDKVYRGKLKKYVKYSINYNGLDSVFGIESFKFHNGINLEDIPIKKDTESKDIRLVGVATMNFWHGYDRLIRGMAEYYGTGTYRQEVYLKLVGLGKEIPRYKDLIANYGLEKYIELSGIKQRGELAEEYDNSDIAIGSLGMYRLKMETASPIKAKEYCARGIPMVLGYEDLAFSKKVDFIFRVPNDGSSIDIYKIIEFYKAYKLKKDKDNMREYARQQLTWNLQFEQIICSIKLKYPELGGGASLNLPN